MGMRFWNAKSIFGIPPKSHFCEEAEKFFHSQLSDKIEGHCSNSMLVKMNPRTLRLTAACSTN